MMSRTALVVILAGLLSFGCSGTDDCPLGQVMYDGECVDLVPNDATALCAPGTYLMEGQCWADPTEICGANTVVEWLVDEFGEETGEFICVGKGGTGCDILPECPEPGGDGKICLNGWVKYFIDPDNPTDQMVSPMTFEATTLEVLVYDPIAYVGDPSIPPLGRAEVDPECGTFKVEGVEVPFAEFIALVVDDNPTTGNDDFVFTGFAYPAQAGTNLLELDAYGVTAAQIAAWTAAIGDAALQAAGCGAGEDLVQCGTWAGVFAYWEEDTLVPITGAQPRNGTGTPPPVIPYTKLFYLNDDHDSFSSATSDADSYTNDTGTVFFPTAQLGNFTGTCAAGTSCQTDGRTWEIKLGGGARGAFFVQLHNPIGL